jgi:hypothetical protein
MNEPEGKKTTIRHYLVKNTHGKELDQASIQKYSPYEQS